MYEYHIHRCEEFPQTKVDEMPMVCFTPSVSLVRAGGRRCRKQIISLVNHATVNYGMKLVQLEAFRLQRKAKRSSVQSFPDLQRHPNRNYAEVERRRLTQH